jgi:hypothetical protein
MIDSHRLPRSVKKIFIKKKRLIKQAHYARSTQQKEKSKHPGDDFHSAF